MLRNDDVTDDQLSSYHHNMQPDSRATKEISICSFEQRMHSEDDTTAKQMHAIQQSPNFIDTAEQVDKEVFD